MMCALLRIFPKNHCIMTTCFFSLLSFLALLASPAPVSLPQEGPLVARYDLMDLEEVMAPKKRDYLLSVNRSAKTGNTTINEIFSEKYPYEYKLVGLSQVKAYKEEG
jgi:hypothetical protein